MSQKNEIFTQWNFSSAKQLNVEMCSQTVLKLIDLKTLILNLRKLKPNKNRKHYEFKNKNIINANLKDCEKITSEYLCTKAIHL